MEFISKIFDVSDFPARWHCGNWSPAHGWLHIVSDILIWGAYMAIPILLTYFIRKRNDIPFLPIFWLFAAFIFACGTSHLVEASIFWWPAYRLSGVVKLATAAVSWATVIALIPVVPKALNLPKLEKDYNRLTDTVDWLQNVFDATPEGIIVVNSQGAIVYSNEGSEYLFGYTREEFEGLSVHDLVPVAAREGHHGLFNEFMANPEKRAMGYGRDLHGLRKDGSTVPVEIGLNPVEINGQFLVVTSIVDITERIQAQEEQSRLNTELEKRNKELDEFAYVASHDMRSPLEGIDNLAEWIEEDAGDVLPEDSKRHLALIRNRINRAKLLLDDFLEYSRVGRKEHRIEHINTADLIQSVVDGFEETTPVELNLPDNLPELDVPSTPYYQIWSNLVRNAIKHNDKEATRLTIHCEEKQDHYIFGVEDNGPGIPEEFRVKIFGQFETLQARDEKEGSGMGLAICKKITEVHGGRIWVESDGESGSTFYFEWPKVFRKKHSDHSSEKRD